MVIPSLLTPIVIQPLSILPDEPKILTSIGSSFSTALLMFLGVNWSAIVLSSASSNEPFFSLVTSGCLASLSSTMLSPKFFSLSNNSPTFF